MKKYILKSKVFLKFMIVILVFGFLSVAYKAYATDIKPVIDNSVSLSKSSVYVNEEFDLIYTLKPEPLAFSDINSTIPKEIVLVLDTSGSMNQNIGTNEKINSLKSAANKFIEEFANVDNVKIGIVSYSFSAKIKQALTSSRENQYSLKSAIDRLSSDGATNIGDGIRVAYNMFSKNTSAKKYLVMMSDGEPTSLTYSGNASEYSYTWNGVTYNRLPDDLLENSKWQYYGVNSTQTLKYGTYVDKDPKGYCLKYSKLMATELKNSGIQNYFIGFDLKGNNANLNDIAKSGDGHYYDADDEEAIIELYSNIAEKIKDSYIVENVKMNFTLPNGIELANTDSSIIINEGKYEKIIQDIEYKLDPISNKYIAKPFNIPLSLKATESGTIPLGGSGWTLGYKTLDKTITTIELKSTSISVNKYDIGFQLSRKLIPEVSVNSFDINKEFEIQYEIKPNSIEPQTAPKPKEIMLVVDTSGSMAWAVDEDSNPIGSNKSRLDLTKEALYKFLDKFKDRSDVKIGIVTYASNGQVYKDTAGNYLFNANDSNKIKDLKSKVNSLNAYGSTNVGDGIRRAVWALSSNTNSQKYMVLMTDGEPSAYSYNGTNKSSYYTIFNDITSNYYPRYYGEGDNPTKGLEYAKLMASKLKEIEGVNIKPFSIGYATDTTGNKLVKLEAINELAGGDFFDATKNDKTIEEVYSKIADEIKTDFTLSGVSFSQSLPSGLISTENVPNPITKDFNINYTYNPNSKKYEAEPISFSVKVKGIEVRKYELKSDAKLSYKDFGGALKEITFNDLNINIIGEFAITQGLFQLNGNNPSTTHAGLKYIKDIDGSELTISPNMEYQVGTFVKTIGQRTDVNIQLNSNNNAEVSKINITSIDVYSVDSNGSLVKLENITPTIYNNGLKIPKISVTLTNDLTNEYKYYIINYNYKVDRVDEVRDDANNIIINKASTSTSSKAHELKTKLSKLPDLF